MATITSSPSTATTLRGAQDRPQVWKHGVLASITAAVVVTALAGVGSAVGIGFSLDGTSIPLLGFANLTVIFSAMGVVLAAVLARTVRRPRAMFVRSTVALTALSLLPDVTLGFDLASAVALMVLHLVAAAIVIPVLARRLPLSR